MCRVVPAVFWLRFVNYSTISVNTSSKGHVSVYYRPGASSRWMRHALRLCGVQTLRLSQTRFMLNASRGFHIGDARSFFFDVGVKI